MYIKRNKCIKKYSPWGLGILVDNPFLQPSKHFKDLILWLSLLVGLSDLSLTLDVSCYGKVNKHHFDMSSNKSAFKLVHLILKPRTFSICSLKSAWNPVWWKSLGYLLYTLKESNEEKLICSSEIASLLHFRKWLFYFIYSQLQFKRRQHNGTKTDLGTGAVVKVIVFPIGFFNISSWFNYFWWF